MSDHPDLGRRRFLSLRSRHDPPPLRPPWTTDASVAAACTRCGDCLTACPEGILRAGSGGFPEVDFHSGAGACTFCGACADACAEPVFTATAGGPWDARAQMSDACLARSGVHCQSCGDACAERAIRFRLARGAPPQPTLDAAACTGCGACVGVCPAGAVSVRAMEGVPA